MGPEGFWKVFWKGGESAESEPDRRSPPLMDLPRKPLAVLRAGLLGMSFPWKLAVATILGVSMVAVPGVLDVAKPASTVFHLAGSLVAVVSVIAMGEPVRMGRYLNVLLGGALAVGPWLLDGGDLASRLAGLVAGLLVVVLSLPRGPVHERFGSWDSLVR